MKTKLDMEQTAGVSNPEKLRFNWLKNGLGIVLLGAVMGCVGYVDGGGGVYVAGPDVAIFGGGFERGHDVRVYSHRGAMSRAGHFHGRR